MFYPSGHLCFANCNCVYFFRKSEKFCTTHTTESDVILNKRQRSAEKATRKLQKHLTVKFNYKETFETNHKFWIGITILIN